ncbi:sister chromatid cohesion protein 1 [Dipsacomyces acuminosporus]|nr:sister chromatid cohesion protein 1 [Dipsacomyces acuminosporus]
MFYAEAILSKKGPLAKVWLAAHLERKLTKAQLLQASIPNSVGAIIGQDHGPPLALRLSGQLLLGVVRIYARKARYLLEDCNDALVRIKMAFRPGVADVTSETVVASHNAITLPEALTEFDILLPSPVRIPGLGSGAAEGGRIELEMAAAAAAMNTSRIQDITLAEQSFDISGVARSAVPEAMMLMGEEDLLGRDEDFRLDLDDEFILSPPPQELAEPLLRLEESALEPEIGREAMQGLEESMVGVQPEDISLLGKGVGGLEDQSRLMDITREEFGGELGGDILRFGDESGLAISGRFDESMLAMPSTQEVALQEAEAEVLAASTGAPRPAKRRRLNLSDLVTSEATSLSPDEIRGRLNDAADIVRVPTYLPPNRATRLEDVSSAAIASRFLSSDSITPFAALFENVGFGVEQEVPGGLAPGEATTSGLALGAGVTGAAPESVVPEAMGEFRFEEAEEEISFGAGLDVGAESVLLADKSIEQLERLEEESFMRQAEEQHHEGVSLFADALPVRDEDISLHAAQLDGEAVTTLESVSVVEAEERPEAEVPFAAGPGYSKSTIRAIHLIDTACRSEDVPASDTTVAGEDKSLSYLGVTKGARREDAVKMFFELLVLKSRDFIDVKQSAPFEDILIAPRTKLRRAADSIQVASTVSI